MCDDIDAKFLELEKHTDARIAELETYVKSRLDEIEKRCNEGRCDCHDENGSEKADEKHDGCDCC